MAGSAAGRVARRNGVVEFDDPDTGKHVVILDGMTVESGDDDALAVISIAAIISCGVCMRRRITPIEAYRHGWDCCGHCGARLFLPPLEDPGETGGG